MYWLTPRSSTFPTEKSEAYLVHLKIPDGFGEEARSDQI